MEAPPYHFMAPNIPPIQTDFVLQHPTPGSDSLHGLHLSNVERLEQTAERISVSSTDLAEEIRKIWQEQKRRDSRASWSPSRSSKAFSTAGPSRHNSSKSQICSSRGVSNEAPRPHGGSITAPISPVSVHSPVSNSWSRVPGSSNKRGSGAVASGNYPLLEQERRPHDASLAAPLPATPILAPHNQSTPLTGSPRHLNGEKITEMSFGGHDACAGQVECNPVLQVMPNRGHIRSHTATSPSDRIAKEHISFREDQSSHDDDFMKKPSPDNLADVEGKSSLTIIGNTHGVDMSFDTTSGAEPTSLPNTRESKLQSPTRQSRHTHRMSVQPSEEKVYYPAPVPRTLNLPQRLSQQLPANKSSRPSSQFYGAHPAEVRKSAIWLQQPQGEEAQNVKSQSSPFSGMDLAKQRQSYLGMQTLPPQLRASVFFHQPSVTQEVEIKDGSAVATLDSFLDASAQAPFTTLAARIASEGGGKSAGNSSSTLKLLPDPIVNARSHGVLVTSSNREDGQNTRYDMPNKALNVDHPSMMNYANEAHHQMDRLDAGISENTMADVEATKAYYDSPAKAGDIYRGHDESFTVNSAPTTLLAELQLRKEHQRLRTRTAANAFPTGMHATLLEVDTVYQMQQKLRQSYRPALVWEGQFSNDNNVNDENVPLGLLTTARNQDRNTHGNRHSMGLMEKHGMEAEDSMSHRQYRPKASNFGAGLPATDRDQYGGETLAQRTRRLKEIQALNSRSEQASPRDTIPAVVGSEQRGETLAQRRTRLQTSQAALQDHYYPVPQAASQQQGLSQQYSYASQAFRDQKIGLHPSGLLAQGIQHQEAKRQHVRLPNMGPGSGGYSSMPDFRNMTGQENYAMRPARGGFMGGMYNDSAGGTGPRSGSQNIWYP